MKPLNPGSPRRLASKYHPDGWRRIRFEVCRLRTAPEDSKARERMKPETGPGAEPTLRRVDYRPLPDFLAPSAERASSSILMRDSAAANACSASESAGITT
jgi:hypothetical protein